MNNFEIRYHFSTDSGLDETFDLAIDCESMELTLEPANNLRSKLPSWTNLDFHQCPHCPLDASLHPNCPAAACLVDVIMRLDCIASYDRIDVEVTTDIRRVTQTVAAQRGISSLIGLLFAVSGCPHAAFFRPMARLHLPMSSEEDTIFRATGMYLIAQLFLRQEGKDCDLELTGLKKIYRNLHIVNTHMADRIRNAGKSDSSVNALILLDLFTSAVPFIIEDQLEEIRYMFTPYLSDSLRKLMDINDMV